MKVLIVSQYFWPEDFRINDIAKGLKEAGYEVEILTGIPNYPSGKTMEGFSLGKREFSQLDGMKIYRTAMVTRGKGSIRLALNYISFMILGSLRAVPLLFKKYDRIFVFQLSPITSAIPALLLSKVKKVPSYIYVQDLWPETFYSIINIENLKLRKLFKKICNKIYDSFFNILISSEGFRDILIKEGINENKIRYFPQWAEDFYSNEIKEKDIDRIFTVTFAGNVGKAQSIETIIKAAKYIEQREKDLLLEIKIIGEGSEFKNIKDLVEAYKLEGLVKLLGRKPSREMPKYFNESDGLIVTLSDEEILKVTLPAKVQSYMAAGKPIIGAISGEGNKIIRESKCGLVGEARDYETLGENIIKLYNMKSTDREILGSNGKRYFANNFTREKLLSELERIMS